MVVRRYWGVPMSKERIQLLVLWTLIGVLIVALFAAARLQSGQPKTSSGYFYSTSDDAPSQPKLDLRRRDSAASRPDFDNIPNMPAQGKEGAASPSESLPEEPPPPEVQAAFNAATPEEAIAQLMAGLVASAETYTALGSLHAQTNPPNLAAAEAAFAQAAALAQSAEERTAVAYAHAGTLRAAGKPLQALETVQRILRETLAATAKSAELRIVAGDLLVESGDADGAERAYLKAAEEALALFDSAGADARAVYRQACLRLAQHYRATGEPGKADGVARTMRARLSRSMPQ